MGGVLDKPSRCRNKGSVMHPCACGGVQEGGRDSGQAKQVQKHGECYENGKGWAVRELNLNPALEPNSAGPLCCREGDKLAGLRVGVGWAVGGGHAGILGDQLAGLRVGVGWAVGGEHAGIKVDKLAV